VITFGGRTGRLRTDNSGRYGCSKNLSVLFFPNSVFSPYCLMKSHSRSSPWDNDAALPSLDFSVPSELAIDDHSLYIIPLHQELLECCDHF
jgi:hypothetical protein